MKGKPINFDPKFLKESEPLGIFVLGRNSYEFHVDIVVMREGDKITVWSNKFSRELTKAALKSDNGWKTFLEK